MRERAEIEKEMYRAREDLEQRISELKHVVRDTVDVRARARAVVAEKKQQARELAQRGVDGARRVAVRGKDGVVRAYERSRDFSRERPVLIAAIAGGVVLATVATILLVRHYRRPWYARRFS